MPAARDIVAQQRRRLVHVHHRDVHVAVVVEIAERTAPAGVRRRDATASFLDQFLEAAVAQIAKHESRRSERIRGQRPFHFRVHAAGDEEQVRKPIVVQIDDARSPSDKPRFHADARRGS